MPFVRTVGCYLLGVMKKRLDVLLVEKGMFESRQKAQGAILAGEVFVDGQRIDKPGSQINEDAPLSARQRDKYVGRGGLKLEAALRHFAVDPTGWTCADVGASTGGFTDCLLQHGAAHVYAFDVGHSQLAWKIRNDPRVTSREKFNARFLTPKDLPVGTRLGVTDVSFISLNLILEPLARAIAANLDHRPNKLEGGGCIVALIKPQFELERADVGRGGIVRDAALHERAVEKVRSFVELSLPDWRWTGVMDSPILGTEGNKEFLACLKT